MGIVSIQNLSDSSMLGLWHITETTENLIGLLDLDLMELLELYDKRTAKRKNEWLSCRVLLKEMLGQPVRIEYDLHGKPSLSGMDTHISMSHSGSYSCVYLDQKRPVGVDIQQIKPSISAGADFFLNENEKVWVNHKNNLQMHLIWSVKESVFKQSGIPELNLKEDIKLQPFESNQNHLIEVNLYNQGATRKVYVRFMVIDSYVLTWTV